MAGTKTNIITAVLIKDRDAADSPQLPELLDLTARHFNIMEVSADKGYASVNNHEIITAAGAEPYIAHKKRDSERRGGVWAKSVHLYRYHREEFNGHYHKRSNIETSFWMVKSKFGGYVRSKTPTAMMNEVLCKVLAHNICVVIQSIYELGIVPEFFVEQLPEGGGQ
jgi:transposase